MTNLSEEFKQKVAELYLKNKTKMEKLDPPTMESFATKTLEFIKRRKRSLFRFMILQILEYNMGLLKNYSAALEMYTPDSDEYDFTQNDCKSLVDSTKKWLTLEKMI